MQALLGVVVFLGLVAVGLFGLQAGGAIPQATMVVLSAGVGLGVWKTQEDAKNARDLETKLGSDKAALYKLYMDVLRETVENAGKLDDRATQRLVRRLRSFAFSALLIGADEVVLAHDRFMNAGRIGETMVVPALADVVLAMRRDAHGATQLQTIDVLATFIKAEDIDKMRPLCDEWMRERAKAWPMRAAGQGK